MTHVVTGRCMDCKYTDCVRDCPVDECFKEGPKMLYIDPNLCIDCTICVSACPVNAIFKDDEVPGMYKDYLKINEEQSKVCPPIDEKQDALPTARTIEQILEFEQTNCPIQHDES